MPVMNGTLNPVWRTQHTIASYDADPRRRAGLPALCRFMQEAAYQHAAHLGLGHADLARRNLGWVLARQRIDIGQLPRWEDTVQIRTWPSGRDRLFFYRDFEITDDSGKMLLRAATAWSLIDIEKRMKAASDIYMDVDLPECKPVFDVRPKRLKGIAHTEGERVSVSYGDLDLNGHVNNVRYIEWMLNQFSRGFHELHMIRKLECNYLAEAVYGRRVSVYADETESKRYNHTIMSEEMELFRAHSTWIDDENR